MLNTDVSSWDLSSWGITVFVTFGLLVVFMVTSIFSKTLEKWSPIVTGVLFAVLLVSIYMDLRNHEETPIDVTVENVDYSSFFTNKAPEHIYTPEVTISGDFEVMPTPASE